MKKIFFFIVCLSVLLTFSLQAVAQGGGHRHSDGGRGSFDREDFIAKRNVFITERIALTTEEAVVFIPMDNELMQKKFEVGRECHRIKRDLNGKKNKSDEEYNKLLKCREELKEKRDKLDREYLEKFKRVLSAEQILKYQSADREFYDEYIRNRRR